MKSYRPFSIRWSTLALVVSVGLTLLAVSTRAQEAGGELGGGAGIFRPKNPETKSKRRIGGARPPTVSRKPKAVRGGPSAEEIEEMVEDKLDEGNEARDARNYAGGREGISRGHTA